MLDFSSKYLNRFAVGGNNIHTQSKAAVGFDEAFCATLAGAGR